jgi:hypothetical protein
MTQSIRRQALTATARAAVVLCWGITAAIIFSTKYNTFGLEWNENEIILYINGVETDRLSGKWVPQVKQYLLLSVEVAAKLKISALAESLSLCQRER